MNRDKPIFVTRPHLPPLKRFLPYLEEIWQNRVLTNGGKFHELFEKELAEYLNVEFVSLFANGTLGLLTSLQALEVEGEVITTPFSFAATAHALVWNRLQPVFVDIEESTLNIDPGRIEEAITQRTSAILAVHVYGQPCNTVEIERIATKHNLKVIYDAAHAFGVRCNGDSFLNKGDLSVLSFHATKVFNTFEGGAVVSHNAHTKKRIDNLKNFGFIDETNVVAAGINGKMNEFSAALGILQLEGIDSVIERRRLIAEKYYKFLDPIVGIKCLKPSNVDRPNFTYFPIIIEDAYGESRDELYWRLRREGVIVRRYFYPLISSFPMYRNLSSALTEMLPVASEVSERVLCLPIFPDLRADEQDLIIGLLTK